MKSKEIYTYDTNENEQHECNIVHSHYSKRLQNTHFDSNILLNIVHNDVSHRNGQNIP